MPNSEMLERWAAAKDLRTAIEDFLDWAETAGRCYKPINFVAGREAALDEFFLINRRQLEKERRALLESAAPRV